MTREKLRERVDSRERFRATFSKYGLKTAYKGLQRETILLLNVKPIQGEELELTDHLWFNLTKGFKGVGSLYPGDVVAFDARVRPYMKGYVGQEEVDYKLSHPTKIKIVETAEREDGYYRICPGCGHHNVARLLGDWNSCRRCGFKLNERPLPEPKEFLQKKLFE